MHSNAIREWIGLVAAFSVLFCFGGMMIEMNKTVIETPKYYVVWITLMFWLCVGVICFANMENPVIVPKEYTIVIDKPFVFSTLSFAFSAISIIILVLGMFSVNYVGDELTDTIRIKTEASNYCCIYQNNTHSDDCGCLKYEGKLEKTIGIFNKLKKGKRQIVHCEKCQKLSSFTFCYHISITVNIISSIVVLFLAYLHLSLERKYMALLEKQIKVDEAQYVEEQAGFVKNLIFGTKEEKIE
ncbi:hypothetical protein EIN_184360 [Entamoeba invadens IP1]|uniref:hypothetical protein n=1 Tax=Entamoeba invadens IP1 TaxID=370355 RepID=UPI0002C3EBC1|nr:hypothetical protein EIN_184360 [Entamoeba invadens IP1]ELP94089.1 hypothetical protein EIN_184360 [Entamoeba invadens IP1]|eukprot:XP_004260860.1 hypothetical protein EIN_184360 [Entamoeba invadens IP1]